MDSQILATVIAKAEHIFEGYLTIEHEQVLYVVGLTLLFLHANLMVALFVGWLRHTKPKRNRTNTRHSFVDAK